MAKPKLKFGQPKLIVGHAKLLLLLKNFFNIYTLTNLKCIQHIEKTKALNTN